MNFAKIFKSKQTYKRRNTDKRNHSTQQDASPSIDTSTFRLDKQTTYLDKSYKVACLKIPKQIVFENNRSLDELRGIISDTDSHRCRFYKNRLDKQQSPTSQTGYLNKNQHLGGTRGYMPDLWPNEIVSLFSSRKIKRTTNSSYEQPKEDGQQMNQTLQFFHFDKKKATTRVQNKEKDLAQSPSQINKSAQLEELTVHQDETKKSNIAMLKELIGHNRENYKLLAQGGFKENEESYKRLKLAMQLEKSKIKYLNKSTRILDRNRYILKVGFSSKNSKAAKVMETERERDKKPQDQELEIQHLIAPESNIGINKSKQIVGTFHSLNPEWVHPLSREQATLSIYMTPKGPQLLLFGGYVNGEREAAYTFDIGTNRWESANYPESFPCLAGHSAMGVDRTVFIFGGKNIPKPYQKGKIALLSREVIAYKHQFGWERFLDDNRVSARADHICIELGKDLLIGGGIDENYNRLNDFWYTHLDQGITEALPYRKKSFIWRNLVIENQRNFPRLSGHRACLAIHNDFKMHEGGGLEYMRQCSTKDELIERKKKLQGCGIYVFGGMDDQNFISDKLIHLSVDVHPHKWQIVEGKGTKPPPIFDFTMKYLKKCKTCDFYNRERIRDFRRQK